MLENITSAVQKGYNSKYPKEVLVWKKGDFVPEWLSNRVKIVALDIDTGSPIPEFRKNGWENGYALLDSGGVSIAVSVKNINDFVCFDESTGKLFSLNPRQLNLLYNVK